MYFSLCHENSFFLKEDTTFIRFSINNSQFLNLAKPIADKIDTAILYSLALLYSGCYDTVYSRAISSNFGSQFLNLATMVL